MKKTCLLLILALCPSTVRAQEPPPPPPPQPTSFLTPCVIGGAVLVGGLYVAWRLKKLCDQVFPSTNAPPPPPTNNIPIRKPPPASTNRVVNLAANNFNVWTFDGSQAETDPDGNPYLALISGTIQTSTNLTDWDLLCGLNAWISPGYILSVWNDSAGPVSTNLDLIGSAIQFDAEVLPGGRLRFFK